MDYKPKNREWVKNAAIVFLVVLLILTFFSNTIRNRTLPEVATQYVESGSITAKVRGSGTVSANGIHSVKADQTREIRAVMVKVGQEVAAGDVLFVLGAGDSAELEQAQDTLRQLQTSYQKSAISIPEYDYTLDNKRIQRAEEQKAAAKEDLDIAYEKLKENIQVPQETIDEAKKNADKAQKDFDEVNAKTFKDKFAAQERVNNAQAALDEALKNPGGAPSLPQAKVPDTVRFEISEKTVPASAEPELDGSGNTGAEKTEPTTPPQTQTTVECKLINVSEDMKYQVDDGVWMNVLKSEKEVILHGFVPENSSVIKVVRRGAAGETRDSDFFVIEFNNAENLASYRIIPAPAPEPPTDGESAAVKAARKNLEDAKAELVRIETDSNAAVALAQSNLDRCKELLDRYLNSGGALKEAYDKALADYNAADDNLLTLTKELELKKQSDSKNSQLAYIDLSDIATQMEKQKQIIKELSGGEENTITANVPGTIQTVDCTAGDTKLKDDLLCSIEVPDMGYTLSFSVTNDQARRLRPGDSATVSNYYWGSEIIATLNSIKVDPKNPQSNKILTFDLEGDVNAGSELTISVGQKSANYDVIIPNSSIRTDTNGSFVLKIEAKNSPLGNRYIARRVSVEVLAADDVNSAVTGDLTYGDYVITTSNAPVKAGDQVRMAES